jgi:hypothetical protein
VPNASVKGTDATVFTTEKLCPAVIVLGREAAPPACANAFARPVPPTWLVAAAWTEFTPPNVEAKPETEEAIGKVSLASRADIWKEIRAGEIKDNFTVTALSLYEDALRGLADDKRKR